MSYATHREVDASAIPVIDIEPLRDGSGESGVARQIYEASRDVGFLYIRNHGIDEELIAETYRQGLAFFRQTDEAKRAVSINRDHRGYLRPGASKMDDDVTADLKESFVWGHDFPQSERTRPIEGVNQWPRSMPRLRPVLERYFDAASEVARHVLRGCALGLGLPANTFLQGVSRPLSRASLAYYPPQPETLGPDVFGVSPHTDFGVLTVLCQDEVGGLEVQDYEGDWVVAQPVPDTLVVNVGDLLARWSNDKLRSTPHRVINRSSRERLSMVVAFDPDFDTLIDPSVSLRPGEVPVYDPITCGDYLVWRFARAFTYDDTPAS